MNRNALYILTGLLLAANAAYAASTGMPWETGTAQLGNSLTKFIAPTVAIAGGALGFLDMFRHSGSVSHMGGTAFTVAAGGLAASLWPAAMNLMGVSAALV